MDSFEVFRRDRNRRRQQLKVTERPAGHSEVWEQLEKKEANELQEEILNAEVDEFFADATRLAATIVQRVTNNREQEISGKLIREMEEFLRDSIQHATNMVVNLNWQKARDEGGGETTLEPSVKNLGGEGLDEFRAEGTAQLSDKHFGQDPFLTALDAPSGVYRAVVRNGADPAAGVGNQEAEQARQADSIPTDAPGVPAPSRTSADDHRIPLDHDEDDSDLADRQIRVSESELSLDCGAVEDPNFCADEFDARISGVASIQRKDERPRGDTEDDMPLAATYRPEDTYAPHETSTPEAGYRPDTDAPAPAAPEVDAATQAIRDALLLLVRQGVMTKDQARAAYRRQMQ